MEDEFRCVGENIMQKTKRKKVIKIILIVVVVFLVVDGVISIVLAGSMGGIGPFKFLHENKMAKAAGNAEEYHLDRVEALEGSPLKGKNILFLGSSVTKGACSLEVSMADYIGKLDGCNVTKEAASGTTLATLKGNSYVERLKKLDTGIEVDLLVCQLSTNDASQSVPLGNVSDSMDMDSFDTGTVIGAIEYIIAYAKETWGCQIVFYTGTKYDSENYQAMVDGLYEVQGKWGIGVIDLWNDEDMNMVSADDYAFYMYDSIHPTQAGYLLWWTPRIEEYLYDYVE